MKEKRPFKKRQPDKAPASTIGKEKQEFKYKQILSSGDTVKAMEKINVPVLDVEDFIDDDESEYEQNMEIQLEEEERISDSLDIEPEDEDLDFDEIELNDPFEVEKPEGTYRGRYIVKAEYNKKNDDEVAIVFIESPVFDTDDETIMEALLLRQKILKKIALIIAKKQQAYLQDPKRKNLQALEQKEVLGEIKEHFKQYNVVKSLDKHHMSRMVSSLNFLIPNFRIIPASSLFIKKLRVTDITKQELIVLAKDFLNKNQKYKTKTDEAKAFWDFIKEKTGKEVALSKNAKSEGDRFKPLRNLLKDIKKDDNDE